MYLPSVVGRLCESVWGGESGMVMKLSAKLSFGSLVACAILCVFIDLVGVLDDTEMSELKFWLGICTRFGFWVHDCCCSV